MKTETPVASNYDLRTHKFPEVNGLDTVFSTMRTDKILLAEAERLGFDRMSNPYNKIVNTIFYSGGKVIFKKDVEEDFRNRVYLYFRAFIRSWEPKHEHKEAICAYLLSHICEPQLETKL